MINDVIEMHKKFGFSVESKPTLLTRKTLNERLVCMQEELDEFADGIDCQSIDHQADALVDLVYFALGTAAMMGIPWYELWDDVHRANMAKERGITKRGHAEDLVKPEGWEGPKTRKILIGAGYEY